MKVMHNIGLLLVRMGKFRDAVTNFQHIMHEKGDFQTGKCVKKNVGVYNHILSFEPFSHKNSSVCLFQLYSKFFKVEFKMSPD